MGLIESIASAIATYNRASLKPYKNIKHVMIKDGELLVPSDNEEYTFRLDEGWKVTHQNSQSVIIRRSNNGTENRKEEVQTIET